MSYTPTNWQSGDKVTAEKLNKIEQGIANASAVVVLTETYDSTNNVYTLNKSWSEMYQSMSSGTMFILPLSITGDYPGVQIVSIYGVYQEGDTNYTVYTSEYGYSTTSQNGYPSRFVVVLNNSMV